MNQKLKCLLMAMCIALCSITVSGCGKSRSDNKLLSYLALFFNNNGIPLLSNEDFKKIMDDLGVDVLGIQATNPKDANGNDLPGNYNPLSSTRKAINKTCELYMAGLSTNQAEMPYDALIDASAATPFMITTDKTASWAADPGIFHKSIAADTDGDGTDEIINAIFDTANHTLTVKEIRKAPDSDTYPSSDIYTLSDAAITAANIDAERCVIETGDIDGDGSDELLVAYNGTLKVLDDRSKSYAVLVSKTYPSPGGRQFLRVRVGNFDLDNPREIVVANGGDQAGVKAIYYLYDDLVADPAMDTPIGTGEIKYGAIFSLRAAAIAVGDFNGDRLPDVAFGGESSGVDGEARLVVLQTTFDENSRPKLTLIEGKQDLVMLPKGGTICAIEAMSDVFINSDSIYKNVSLLLIGSRVYYLNATNDFVIRRDFSLPGPLGIGSTLQNIPADGIRTGDVDGDGYTDIVFFNNRYTIDVNTFPETITVHYGISSYGGAVHSKSHEYTISIPAGDSAGAICLAGTSPAKRPVKNTIVIEYVGHEVLFTSPNVLAVIASPPYHKGIAQAEGSTSFGESKTHSTSQSHQVGASAYLSVGFESEFSILFVKIGSLETEQKISAGFNWTTNKTREITTSYAHTTPSGEDMAIVSVVPYDVYYYKIIKSSHGESDIGKTMVVNQPRKPITIPVTVEYFNSHNGPYFDIDSTVLCHALGNPFTYATFTKAQAMLQGGKGYYTPRESGKTIGQGSGLTTLSMEETITAEQSYEVTGSVSIDAKLMVTGATFGAGLEFNYAWSRTTSFGSGTAIEGSVGNITGGDFNFNLLYDWGLLTYTYTNENAKQFFPIVTYWVERI